ncbi:hypothetical protein Ahy_B03g066094 [Arachis hypogaea]|uniref:Uncharacterized protein n=1 Tax=Arachis hypogaea TaxID=3818 RepID=A0A445A327_ARAHY|nr:hypothetical protein Ahy_B03g066094 [Arachis hypogaea]
MERNIHALHSYTRASRKPLLNGALFHFSKPFEENTTVPFSSNIANGRDSNRREDSNSPSTQHRTLDQEYSRCYCSCCSSSSETMAGRNQVGKNQTKDLNCATHLLSEKFRNMSEEKKTIVRDLEFGGLMHIPPLRVHHQILRELANSFKLGENKLETGYGLFKISPKTIGVALGINASGDLFPQKVNYKDLSEDDKQIFRRFQGKTLKNLTDEMMVIVVDNEQGCLMFKRIFILYIQMAFLLPTKINKISPAHLTPIFKMDTITERNWGGHVLNFIVKGITDYKVKKKKAIDGCLVALMIIYFHLSKNKDKKREERPPEPWIANWAKEQLVERMRGEMEDHMGVVKMGEAKEKMKEIKKKRKKKKKAKKKNKKRKASSTSSSEIEKTESDHSTSESETEEDSEDSTRKQPARKSKKMESKKRKKIDEDSDSEFESTESESTVE